MARFGDSLARQFDFGPTTTTSAAPTVTGRGHLRLAQASAVVRGPDKYRVLEQRRRQAQIQARRQLDLLDAREGSSISHR